MWISIVAWVLIAPLLAWFFQKVFWPSRFTLWVNLVVSLIGALVGGGLHVRIASWPTGELLTAILGSIILLIVLRLFGRTEDETMPTGAKSHLVDTTGAVASATEAAVAVGGTIAAGVSTLQPSLPTMEPSALGAEVAKATTPNAMFPKAELADVELPALTATLGEIKADTNLSPPSVNLPDVELPKVTPSNVGASLGEIKPDLDASLPAVSLPDVDLPKVDLPDVNLPKVDLPGVSTSLGTLKADLDASLPIVSLPDAELPKVGLPDVGASVGEFKADLDASLPGVGLPNVEVPKVGLPDISTSLDELKADIDTTLPAVSLPDIDLPKIRLPDVELPNVHVPNVGASVDELNVGLDASLPTASLPRVELLKGDLSNVGASLNELKVGIDAVVPSTSLPEVELPKADLPNVSASLDELKVGIDAVAPVTSLTEVELPKVGSFFYTNYPDDLTEIRGIGKFYEQKLYKRGIFTFAQIAETDPLLLQQYASAIETANVSDWPRQARELAANYGREHAQYVGPIPDKLAAIPGITEALEQIFYRAGIVTYAQLAATDPAQLQQILTNAKRSGQTNVADWIAGAAKLLQPQ